jgi:hypothetical protein
MLNELDEYAKTGEIFAFETTWSGVHNLQHIKVWTEYFVIF